MEAEKLADNIVKFVQANLTVSECRWLDTQPDVLPCRLLYAAFLDTFNRAPALEDHQLIGEALRIARQKGFSQCP